MKRSTLFPLSLLALTMPFPAPVASSAQVARPDVSSPRAVAVAPLSPGLRFASLEERLEEEPPAYSNLWQAAREGALLAAGVEDREERVALLARARGYAEGARERRPEGIEGRYWLAVTSGLLAEEEGGRTKIRLAEEAHRESRWVLSADSTHAGAHHIQGRLHAAVMRLNPVLRFLARQLLGGEVLNEASWERAEHHLRRASELAPEEPVHHLELGVAYVDLDRPGDARAALEAAIAARPRRPVDRLYQARAAALLAETSVGSAPVGRAP